MTDDEKFMAEAIVEAQKGMAEGEVPIGAVAVKGGVVIARGHNKRNALSDITAHAEVVCLRDLSAHYQDHHGNLSFDLSAVTIYSTLEPCAMCLGAMIHYHIGRVVYGERDLLLGACGSRFEFHGQANLEVTGGVLRRESRQPLLDFFEKELGHKSNKWMDIELPKQ
jgi:tRNA(adenine34) deaminase